MGPRTIKLPVFGFVCQADEINFVTAVRRLHKAKLEIPACKIGCCQPLTHRYSYRYGLEGEKDTCITIPPDLSAQVQAQMSSRSLATFSVMSSSASPCPPCPPSSLHISSAPQ